MSDMDERSRRSLDRALDDEFVADLGSVDLEELRQRRELAEQEENLLSYERRLLQGRRDLLAFELERRAGREERTLLEALPDILGGDRHSGRPARQGIQPDPDMPEERRRHLDRLLADDVIARLGEVGEKELTPNCRRTRRGGAGGVRTASPTPCRDRRPPRGARRPLPVGSPAQLSLGRECSRPVPSLPGLNSGFPLVTGFALA